MGNPGAGGGQNGQTGWEVRHNLPAPAAYHALYETTGWNERHGFSVADLERALAASWHVVCVYDGSQLVASGRLVSDGVYQVFVCDVIVLPQYQGRGLGTLVMKDLLAFCRRQEVDWVQLTCARGQAGFYERLGFKARPAGAPGMQLYLQNQDE